MAHATIQNNLPSNTPISFRPNVGQSTPESLPKALASQMSSIMESLGFSTNPALTGGASLLNPVAAPRTLGGMAPQWPLSRQVL